MTTFKALLIEQDGDGKVTNRLTTLSDKQLDDGEVTIRVHYSSINYKDALAATGAGKVIRPLHWWYRHGRRSRRER